MKEFLSSFHKLLPIICKKFEFNPKIQDKNDIYYKLQSNVYNEMNNLLQKHPKYIDAILNVLCDLWLSDDQQNILERHMSFACESIENGQSMYPLIDVVRFSYNHLLSKVIIISMKRMLEWRNFSSLLNANDELESFAIQMFTLLDIEISNDFLNDVPNINSFIQYINTS